MLAGQTSKQSQGSLVIHLFRNWIAFLQEQVLERQTTVFYAYVLLTTVLVAMAIQYNSHQPGGMGPCHLFLS